jgi:hypothetical protein
MSTENRNIFVLTREDVIGCAREMGIPEETITDDVLSQVKKGVEWGLECWDEVMKEAINMALKS